MKKLMACAVALGLGACGTVTRGMNNDVTFNSEPPGAEMRTSTGLTCPATPCTLPISRRQEFVATFSLEGHRDQQVNVTTDISGGGAAGFAGNVLIGGVVGMGVDVATGAALDHKPNPVFAKMEPIVAPRAATAQRGRKTRHRTT
ncbi:translation initiation factor 2 [Bosea sp. NPDC055332]